ncbi:hypothetical protein DE146DRAFT_765582 [Phaeosphaeria sp. MPI-PUGE-AT-0046c]|nr:hypothetical protein DE146DRAFT_765582 [Phaeosphaeria sp. MPI-PUGE-AT-0046c]
MEALIAVGLAGNVVQFVSFAGKLISETIAIRKTGSPSSLPGLRILTNTLTQQAGSIHRSLSNQPGGSPLAPEEQNLIDTAAACEKAGLKFLDYLDALIKQSLSSSRLKSAGASIKFHFYQHKIDDFVANIDKLRSALTLATVLAFRAGATTSHSEVLDHLECLKRDQKIYSEELHASIGLFQADSGPKLDKIDSRVQDCLSELVKIKKRLPLSQERAVISWLNFRQMSWRYEEVPSAYQHTFQWIFEQTNPERGWHDFPSFLKIDTVNPYLINGKAGSGKSTLMKYIVDHGMTRKYLSEWAISAGHELIITRFFFWNLELVPAVFPDLYHDNRLTMEEPSYIEVKRAWRTLTVKSAAFLNIAIFIDGIDEFDGDHKDLSEFLKSLASSSVKIVVSSRPINACLSVFRASPCLRLQELTANDMSVYVQGNLASNEIMVQLAKRYPTDAKEIVAEITEKASGVFVWVKLVVKLLVDGLDDGDDIEELRAKLRSLPSDLRDIYRRMFSKIKSDYHGQAAEIFLLLQAWQSITPLENFNPVTLYCALRPPHEGITIPVETYDPETIAWYSQQVASRVRSRCCGLLFVHIPDPSDERRFSDPKESHPERQIRAVGDSSVTYMHRTVAEFLKSDDVASELHSMTNLDLNTKLLSSCLHVLKICGSLGPTGPLFYHLDYFIKIYRAAASQAHTSLDSFVIELDRTMAQCQYTPYNIWNPYRHWSGQLQDSHEISMGMYLGPLDPMELESTLQHANIFTFAARVCFLPFLRSHCPGDTSQLVNCVCYALESWAREMWSARCREDTTTIELTALCDRRSTLLLLLTRLALSADDDYHHLVLEIADRFLRDFTRLELGIAMSVLMAAFLLHAPDPLLLVGHALFQNHDVNQISQILCRDDDVQNQILGYQLRNIFNVAPKTITPPESPTWQLSRSNSWLDPTNIIREEGMHSKAVSRLTNESTETRKTRRTSTSAKSSSTAYVQGHTRHFRARVSVGNIQIQCDQQSTKQVHGRFVHSQRGVTIDSSRAIDHSVKNAPHSKADGATKLVMNLSQLHQKLISKALESSLIES